MTDTEFVELGRLLDQAAVTLPPNLVTIPGSLIRKAYLQLDALREEVERKTTRNHVCPLCEKWHSERGNPDRHHQKCLTMGGKKT